LAAAVTACAAQKALTVRDAGTGRLYGKWPANDGLVFSVEFVHSVNQSPVLDTFEERDGKINAVSTRFGGYGAGMQTELGPGERLERDGDALLIVFPEGARSYGELRYIVGTVSDHVLAVNGEKISLRDLCGKNAHIVLRVE